MDLTPDVLYESVTVVMQSGSLFTLESGKIYRMNYDGIEYLFRYLGHKGRSVFIFYDLLAQTNEAMGAIATPQYRYNCQINCFKLLDIELVEVKDLPLYVSWYCTPIFEELINDARTF